MKLPFLKTFRKGYIFGHWTLKITNFHCHEESFEWPLWTSQYENLYMDQLISCMHDCPDWSEHHHQYNNIPVDCYLIIKSPVRSKMTYCSGFTQQEFWEPFCGMLLTGRERHCNNCALCNWKYQFSSILREGCLPKRSIITGRTRLFRDRACAHPRRAIWSHVSERLLGRSVTPTQAQLRHTENAGYVWRSQWAGKREEVEEAMACNITPRASVRQVTLAERAGDNNMASRACVERGPSPGSATGSW